MTVMPVTNAQPKGASETFAVPLSVRTDSFVCNLITKYMLEAEDWGLPPLCCLGYFPLVQEQRTRNEPSCKACGQAIKGSSIGHLQHSRIVVGNQCQAKTFEKLQSTRFRSVLTVHQIYITLIQPM